MANNSTEDDKEIESDLLNANNQSLLSSNLFEQYQLLEKLNENNNFHYLKLNDIENTIKYVVDKLLEKQNDLDKEVINNSVTLNKYKKKAMYLEKQLSLAQKDLNEKEVLLNLALEEIYFKNNSLTFKSGKALHKAVKNPLKFFSLPYNLYKIHKEKNNNVKPDKVQISKIIEKINKSNSLSEMPIVENTKIKIEVNEGIKTKKNDTLATKNTGDPALKIKRKFLFVPTNGGGLGHLTRLLAIAKKIKEREPDADIIFFATSIAMHLIIKAGYRAYHLSPKSFFPDELSAAEWNRILMNQMKAIIYTHKPNILIFDGSFPYAGLISSMNNVTLKTVWIKREQSKIEKATMRDSKEKEFTSVLVPGEAGNEFGSELEGERYVSPVIYLNDKDLLSKDVARKTLDIPKGKRVVYLQLGAGNINDINSVISRVVNVLEKLEVFLVIGESVIGKSLNINHPNTKIIRDYPNSKYFNAFDLAISAAGYNTFHELLFFGLPTIFIPNENTASDNQVTRAKIGEAHNACRIVLEKDIDEKLIYHVMELLNAKVSADISKNARSLIRVNGADQIADKILELKL